MLTKSVHCTRDCVGIIPGVQHIDGPLQVKYWGSPDPCDPCGIDAYAKDLAKVTFLELLEQDFYRLDRCPSHL